MPISISAIHAAERYDNSRRKERRREQTRGRKQGNERIYQDTHRRTRTSRHVAQDAELGLARLFDVAIHEPADHGVEQHDKGHAQGRDEEPELASVRLLGAHEGAEVADQVEHRQGRETQGRVELDAGQALEGVDHDLVRRLARVDAGNAQHGGHLADGDADGSTGHEGRDSDERDELDDEAASDEADEEDDAAADDGEGTSNLLGRDVGMLILHLDDDVADDGRHDGDGLDEGDRSGLDVSAIASLPCDVTYADGDVLRCRKCPVEQEANEGRVQAVLRGELRQERVGHALGNDDEANGDTYDRRQPARHRLVPVPLVTAVVVVVVIVVVIVTALGKTPAWPHSPATRSPKSHCRL